MTTVAFFRSPRSGTVPGTVNPAWSTITFIPPSFRLILGRRNAIKHVAQNKKKHTCGRGWTRFQVW